MTLLRKLDLSNNNLYGELPQCHNILMDLLTINLANNMLSGQIPKCFGYSTTLGALHLENNNLSGKIPISLKNCNQLITPDLSGNKLSGSIPAWIGENLNLLKVLSLRSNLFDGNIPMQLSYLSSLQVLDLACNHLTGNLSLPLQNLTAMVLRHDASSPWLENEFYTEEVPLTAKGLTIDYTSTLSAVNCIDLSNNEFSGEIPLGLTQLLGLSFLNLSRNHFIGKIPQNISALQELESLDLSVNGLSGEIPSSMSSMHFLSSLNLSSNNLSGKIPFGEQFTFNDPTIYKDNHGLCGWPLQACSNEESFNGHHHTSHQKKEEHEQRSEVVWIYASAALGFIISFWGFIGTIMLKRSIRYAYFRSVDKLHDWICFKVAMTKAKLMSIMVGREET